MDDTPYFESNARKSASCSLDQAAGNSDAVHPNLLVGRAFVYNLFPLTVPELEDAFDLEDALRWGTLPGIYALEGNEGDLYT